MNAGIILERGVCAIFGLSLPKIDICCGTGTIGLYLSKVSICPLMFSDTGMILREVVALLCVCLVHGWC